MASELSYDATNRQVNGPGFSIKLAGQWVHEDIREIFRYEDSNIDFYFDARRTKWAQLPGKERPGRIVDTETYEISSMWCVDSGCVYQKKDIPEDLKDAARKNVLDGLMLMEGYSRKRPKRVFFAQPRLYQPYRAKFNYEPLIVGIAIAFMVLGYAAVRFGLL